MKRKKTSIAEIERYLKCPLSWKVNTKEKRLKNNLAAFREALIYTFKHYLTMLGCRSQEALTNQDLQNVLWDAWKSLCHKPKIHGMTIYANTFIKNIVKFKNTFKDKDKLVGHPVNIRIRNSEIVNNINLMMKIDGKYIPVYPTVNFTPEPILSNMEIMGDLYCIERIFEIIPEYVLFYDISTAELKKQMLQIDFAVIKKVIESSVELFEQNSIYTIRSEQCEVCMVCDKIDKGEIKMTIEGDVINIVDKTGKKKATLTGDLKQDKLDQETTVKESKPISETEEEEEETDDE